MDEDYDEESPEELLEDDEIESREEAFEKGYEEDQDETLNGDEKSTEI